MLDQGRSPALLGWSLPRVREPVLTPTSFSSCFLPCTMSKLLWWISKAWRAPHFTLGGSLSYKATFLGYMALEAR